MNKSFALVLHVWKHETIKKLVLGIDECDYVAVSMIGLIS